MRSRRPDVTDEDLGIRTHKLRQAQAVQREIERVRHGLGPDWAALTDREIEEFEWVLGELWAYTPREEWHDLRFGHLKAHDVQKLLLFGRELRRHERNAVSILGDMKQVVADRA
ncbi:MAG TPA: hypothetical protein VFH17_04095 [Coriobacteriia bacterium]|nr:hypothetical protein [Coriobacteriia bacterium]